MRCVIIGSATIQNYERIRLQLTSKDYFIYCDGGLNHQEKLGFKPNLIVGDFDSYKKPELSDFPDSELIQLPCEKDDTDVFYAIKEALNRGFTDFVLIGVIGQRFDHSLCNVSVLLYLNEHNSKATIIDDYSQMQLITPENGPVLIQSQYSYFSLMTLDGPSTGITIKNAKYPLENAKISSSYQFGISNEVISGKTAEVSLKKGILLLIKVF